tara:strand:- start:708 stop:1832 length:1125 start_codon:yes stop_codon:yes gene_type:complete
MTYFAGGAMLGSAAIGAYGASQAGGTQLPNMREVYGKRNKGYMNDMIQGSQGFDPRTFYEGQTYADFDPYQIQGMEGMANWSMNNPTAGMQQRQGNLGMNALAGGNQMLQDMYNQGPNQFQFDQGVYDQTMANQMPGMQGQYDDLTRDMDNQFNNQTMPGLDMNLAGSNSSQSSRGGLMEGMLTGMHDQGKMDVGSQLWQNAQNNANQNAMSSGQWNLDSANTGQNMFLNASQSLAGQGLPGLGNAWDTNSANYQNLMNIGGQYQNQNQRQYDEDFARYNYNRDQPWTDVADRMGFINSTVNPNNAYSGQYNNPSVLGTALQGAQAGLGAYGAYQSMFPSAGSYSAPATPYAGYSPGAVGNDYGGAFGGLNFQQ